MEAGEVDSGNLRCDAHGRDYETDVRMQLTSVRVNERIEIVFWVSVDVVIYGGRSRQISPKKL